MAATDPSAGAGLFLDLAAARAQGVPAVAAVAALTAQSAQGVEALEAVPAPFLLRQIEALEKDLGPFAVCKVGALGSPENIRALARWAARRRVGKNPVRLVVDPVCRPSRGAAPLARGSPASLRNAYLDLLRETYLVTPNWPEALWLAGRRPRAGEVEPAALAREILRLGPKAVLLKGGHAASAASVTDLLVLPGGVRRFIHARKQGPFHGTGCYLSTAVAAGLWRGLPPAAAAADAKRALAKALSKTRAWGRSQVLQLG